MSNNKHIIQTWVQLFNKADYNGLALLYAKNAINHQVNQDAIHGREAIRNMFKEEFEQAEMICIIENIFQDNEWVMLEWKDPLGLRGCGFFHIQNELIQFQRGYWDRLSFLRMHKLPLPKE